MAKKKRKLTAWQRHVKSYMATHKGLSFKEALPKAKLTYRKSSRAKSPNPRASSKPRKVKRKMAKRKRRRSNPGMTIPLAPVAGLIAGLNDPIQAALVGDWGRVSLTLVSNYTGYDISTGIWNPMAMQKGLVPLIIGALVHKYVGGAPLNLNRVLARAKVPFIRI